MAHHHELEQFRPSGFGALVALAVAVALSGTNEGAAFRIAPPRGDVVGAGLSAGSGGSSQLEWAEARAGACLAEPEAAVG